MRFIKHHKPLLRFQSELLLLSLSFLLLSGCENKSSPTVQPIAAEPDIVSIKLAQAADRASLALNGIAGIEQQRNPDIKPIENYSGVPSNLMQPVTVRWSGPIEQIARVLAERAGLKFRIKGNVPPVPLTVNVDAYQQPIMHILRDIGYQAGHRADLAIDGIGGVVEIRYAAADQSR